MNKKNLISIYKISKQNNYIVVHTLYSNRNSSLIWLADYVLLIISKTSIGNMDPICTSLLGLTIHPSFPTNSCLVKITNF